MKLLLKAATVIDSKSPFHQKTVDILIEDGTITQIAKDINVDADTVIERKHLHVSQGWFDPSVSFGEPGFEERETIANGLHVAAQSGFTDVILNPNTFPVLDTNADIAFVLSKANGSVCKLHPMGALTQGSQSKDLAELFDMSEAGAIAFGDYQKPLGNPNLLKIALQYAQNFGGLVLSFPLETQIAGKGVMHEHHTSTRIGLKGMPSLSESLQVARDLEILAYTGGRLHIPTISTAKSVALIREAKAKGLQVSCSVAVHNLVFSDAVMDEFDTNFKVLPPLRIEEDIAALKAGLKDGTVDMVTTDHNPLDIEHKKVEFDHASYGTIGLESAFGALNSLFSTEETVDYLTRGKEVFGIPQFIIKEGHPAQLSLFDPENEYVFDNEHIHSASKNSVFLGKTLRGAALGIVRDQFVKHG